MQHELAPGQSEFRACASGVHAWLLGAAEALLSNEVSVDKAGECWQELEDALLRHLRAEEDLLLPEFDLACPSEAASIRAEHEHMRALTERIETALRAHRVDREAVRQLLALLRDTASFEERALYAWADQRLRPRKKSEFVVRARSQAYPTS